MDTLKFSFDEQQTVEFLIDDDANFNWLKTLDDQKYQRYYVYIDKQIEKLYGDKLKKCFARIKKEIKFISIDADESVKSLNSFTENVLLLEKLGLNRYDCLVVIGGGVVIDLVSFIASVYMRGIPLILVPTTLMAQVDATTAGKTCINSPGSKNLVGTLYFAKTVYINTVFISTLPEYELRQAFSEIFKYSLLNSQELLDLVLLYKKKPSKKTLVQIIKGTIQARINIRNVDPLASNLGHTFGHAFEGLSHFEIGHGDSISAGLLMAMKFGEENKVTKKGTFEKVKSLMEYLGLNMRIEKTIDFTKVVHKMQNDKKSSNSSINLVLIKDFTKPYRQSKALPFYPTQPDIVLDFLHRYKAEHPDLFVKGIAGILKSR